jgi:tetratricopeptide (TPR) repeat protein
VTQASTSPEPGIQRRALVALTILGAFGVLSFALSRMGAGEPAAAPAKGVPDAHPLIATLLEQQRPTSAGRVRSRCEGALAEPCGCLKAAVHEALDASLVEMAEGLLVHGKGVCEAPLDGQAAEIAARAGAPGAEAQARAVLAARPVDPYASYALAHLAWLASDRAASLGHAEAAIAAGRGGPAHLLVGLHALADGAVEVARGAFTRVLETEPADVAALYDIALCDHRLGRYRLAREGYLSVLRKNPRHLDARYNIALLTLGAGFRDESAHHVAELRRLSPGDPRVAELEARVTAAPAASASASGGPLAAPPSRPAAPLPSAQGH